MFNFCFNSNQKELSVISGPWTAVLGITKKGSKSNRLLWNSNQQHSSQQLVFGLCWSAGATTGPADPDVDFGSNSCFAARPAAEMYWSEPAVRCLPFILGMVTTLSQPDSDLWCLFFSGAYQSLSPRQVADIHRNNKTAVLLCFTNG